MKSGDELGGLPFVAAYWMMSSWLHVGSSARVFGGRVWGGCVMDSFVPSSRILRYFSTTSIQHHGQVEVL